MLYALTEPFGQYRTVQSTRCGGVLAHMSDVIETPLAREPESESAKRRQILDGAREVFLSVGFDGASMGEVARAAGVSKGTLYVYFADKNRLFEAIVEETALVQGEIAFDF